MEYSLVGEVYSSFYNDLLHKLNLSIAKALVKLSNQWSNRFDPHLGPLIVTQAQSAHEELMLCQKLWVFSWYSGSLPQGKLATWIR